MTDVLVTNLELNMEPLQEQVRIIGNLLGEVLKEQEGEHVLDAVEHLRQGFIGLKHKDDPVKRQQLKAYIESLESDLLKKITRAFNVFNVLSNLVEEDYLHRERRELYKKSDGSLWHGSFTNTLNEIKQNGLTAQELQKVIDQLRYSPVFTAHPTEARRRTMMSLQRRLFLIINKLNRKELTSEEHDSLIQKLKSYIQLLWRTAEVRNKKPTVEDEVRYGLFYFDASLFCSIPSIYRHFERANRHTYGSGEIEVPSFIKFGSWIGGDRDGNPFVTPQVTRKAIRLHMQAALEEYSCRVNLLKNILSHDTDYISLNQAFNQSLKDDEAQLQKQAFKKQSDLFDTEPYRKKLHFIDYRLKANLKAVNCRIANKPTETPDIAYHNVKDFLADLYIIRDSLISHNDSDIAKRDLKDLIRLVETCGFSLYELDVRQESTVHTNTTIQVLKQFLPDTNYSDLAEEQRINILTEQLSRNHLPQANADSLTQEANETLELLNTMREMRIETGDELFGSYVISMTHSASHVLEIMFLARLAGLVGLDDKGQYFCNIKISPLFETIEDLKHIQEVLTNLFENNVYKALLSTSGNLQEVMLGYSDSCKDGGILASRWSLYQAQEQVIALTEKYNIQCRMFHGRGGTVGRGGGPTHEAILSQPPDTVHGQIKFTEQGEVLSNKYSNIETAVYELGMGITGLLKTSQSLIKKHGKYKKEFHEAMTAISETGENTFRELTDHTDGFLDYFYENTPVTEIGQMNIGSRPSHRKVDRSKSSIRAIPWIFGWAQARHTLPAWYGIGSAISKYRKENGEELLKEMYQDWPFFKALISNVQMALFKAQMDIAKEYSLLWDNKAKSKEIYETIHAEYQLTVSEILSITGTDQLMAETPLLQYSLERREPYIDPLNHIQMISLARHRQHIVKTKENESPWLDELLLTINALAAGLRNTG